MSGFLQPVPNSPGNPRENLFSLLLQSLLDANGTSFTQDPASIVYAQAIADSRAIVNGWMEAQRLKYCNDPTNMTDPFLSRWENILGISGYGLNDYQRRLQVALKFKFRIIKPTFSGLNDLLKELLPNTFVELFNYDHTIATSSISIPGGLVIPGYQTLLEMPQVTNPADGYSISSNVHRVYIQVKKPDVMTEGDFQAEVGNLALFLPQFLPAWVGWNWFVVPDDIGHQGFFLDRRNLSYLAFEAG